MSESELEEILNEVKKDAPAKPGLNPPIKRTAERSNDNRFEIFTSDDERELMRRRENRRERKRRKKKKTAVITVMVFIVIAVAVAGAAFALTHKGGSNTAADETESQAVVQAVNPLTGEDGYNQSAVGKRPVAVVVENEYSTEAVRPQWGLGDADIVVEGESEYSTRLLLIWADYTDMPDMIGPVRSARPAFIRFSRLFDCVFIHAGLSKSKGDYVGADAVFTEENVDHINLLDLSDDGTYFGRNSERTTASEHTGYLNGANVPQLISEKGIDTAIDSASFTSLNFSETATAVGETNAQSCEFNWSSGHCPKTASFTYSADSHLYSTTDFDSDYGVADAQFTNLIFLFDETEYVVKEDYKDGQSETYCNYLLSGGEGKILSEGTAVDITWGVTDGKLWMKTADGSDAVLNKGKTYIGYGSSNNGGSITLNPTEND